MSRRRLPNLKATVATLPPIESRYLSRMPCVFAAVGSTGSGKTHVTLSLIKLLRSEGHCTKLYLVCPTVASNVLYSAVLDPKVDKVYSNLDTVYQALNDVQADCLAESELYRQKLLYEIALKRFTAGDAVDAEQEMLLEQFGWRGEKAVRPCPILLLDDVSHSKVYSTSTKNPLTNLVLRSRHCGDGLGLSVMLIAQTWTSGIPRAMRQQLTHACIFRTESAKEIKAIAEEVSSFIAYPDFLAIFDELTKEKHAYMFVDLVQRALTSSF